MPSASWSAATLLLLAHAVPAAQGTHPGPLPWIPGVPDPRGPAPAPADEV